MKQTQMLPILIAAMCERFDITFGVGGSRAYTNWGHIQIPALPLEDVGAKILALGYTVHEIGHNLLTDRLMWNDWCQTAGGFEKGIVGILEDIRMEARLPTVYPGSKSTLKELAEKLVNDGGFEQTTPSMPPQSLLSGFLLYRLRTDVLGQNIDALGTLAKEHLSAVIPEGAMVRLQAMMYEIEEADSVADSISLGQNIIKMLEEEKEKEEEKQQPQNSTTDENQDGDQDENQGGSQASSDENGADDQGQGENSEPENGQNAVDGQDESSDAESNSQVQQGAIVSDRAQALADMLASSGDGMMDMDKLLESMLGKLSSETPNNEKVDLPQTYRYNSKATNPMDAGVVKQQTLELRRRLTELLRAQTRSKRRYFTEGNRLARNRIARIAVGDASVFERRKRGFSPDASVMLLIDRSDSMKNDISLAIEAAAAAGLALENINGVKSAIAAFPYNEKVGMLKDFSESVNRAMDVFPLVRVDGSTPLAEAMLWSGQQLMGQSSKRKVLFVLTDGEPDSKPSTRMMVKLLESHGVEIMGIGIRHTITLFTEQRRVDNIKELPSVVFEMLEDAMLLAA
jgi:hypothetical protein